VPASNLSIPPFPEKKTSLFTFFLENQGKFNFQFPTHAAIDREVNKERSNIAQTKGG